MGRRRVRRAVLCCMALAAGCGRTDAPRIAVVLGGEGARAARLAFETLGASTDPDLRRIGGRILEGRPNSDAAVALAAAETLAADPSVMAVVGHSNSGASIAASQVYNARHVVQLAPTTTSPLYSQAGPYSFRLVAGDDRQAAFLAAQVLAVPGARVAIEHVNDDYGRPLRQRVIAALQARGVVPVYDGAYVESDTTDAEEMVAAIAASRPTLLLWLGRSEHFGRLARPLRRALPGLAVLGSDGFGGAVITRDGDHRFDGVRYVRLVDVAHGSPALQAVRHRMRAAGGGELTDQEALAYDAVMVLAQAIHEAGADREAVRTWLTHLGREHPAYPGITGPVSFDRNGDRAGHYVMETIGTDSTSRAR